ncbi:hypothetical protein GOBAR_AA37983 [Gossypium barbadense]|uniref:G-box binding protein multifunctional mosaic region domain-containing protein n=1 Tax=Gossypium barbadense TaxID=3634 RepID=A0A2P5VV62_GOSBA|nr:hypothetical protein GOBAR_AA37983 [Gossypium barbadense]
MWFYFGKVRSCAEPYTGELGLVVLSFLFEMVLSKSGRGHTDLILDFLKLRRLHKCDMGTEEESTPAKPSKPTASTQEMPTTVSYPDWSTQMQAYYGAAATPPLFASTVASPTPHPYIWGGQHPLMPPYGTPVPYPAVYPPRGVYAHPNVAPLCLCFLTAHNPCGLRPEY